jgi:hypothetical protein
MKIRFICTIVAAGLLFGIIGVTNASPKDLCGRIAVPIDLGFLSRDVEVTSSSLVLDADGNFHGEISLRNKTGRSLSRITLMVNYLDEHGVILFSIPYQAGLATENDDIPNIRAYSKVRLEGPLRPGSTVTLLGLNLLSISIVPKSAELAYWFERSYEDRSSISTQVAHRGFHIDPLPVETPEILEMDLPHSAELVEKSLKLRINEYGRVLDVEVDRPGDETLSSDQIRALSQQFARWHFFPSIENGYAVESDLHLVLEFLPENALPVERCFLQNPGRYPSKFALVKLHPIQGSKVGWLANYGGFPVAGKMETNVINAVPTREP